ncbi:MAG: hypothetical protein V4732_09795 [Pseudomonadota bacterium]
MDKFDIDFALLPPKLQIQLWLLALDADTSKVGLTYQPGIFRYSTSYNYGGNVEASLSCRRFSTTLGASPKGNVDFGLVYRGFSFSTSANFVTSSLATSLNYGANILPFPLELSNTFNDANVGLQRVVRDLGGISDSPLDWYNIHSDDSKAIAKAVRLGKDIARSKKSDLFGASVLLNYAPATGLTIYGAFTIAR